MSVLEKVSGGDEASAFVGSGSYNFSLLTPVDAVGVSAQDRSLTGDGYIRFRLTKNTATSKVIACGFALGRHLLGARRSRYSWLNLSFAIVVDEAQGWNRIITRGAVQGSNISGVTITDASVFKIERVGNQIRFYVNDVVRFTDTVSTAGYSLVPIAVIPRNGCRVEDFALLGASIYAPPSYDPARQLFLLSESLNPALTGDSNFGLAIGGSYRIILPDGSEHTSPSTLPTVASGAIGHFAIEIQGLPNLAAITSLTINGYSSSRGLKELNLSQLSGLRTFTVNTRFNTGFNASLVFIGDLGGAALEDVSIANGNRVILGMIATEGFSGFNGLRYPALKTIVTDGVDYNGVQIVLTQSTVTSVNLNWSVLAKYPSLSCANLATLNLEDCRGGASGSVINYDAGSFRNLPRLSSLTLRQVTTGFSTFRPTTAIVNSVLIDLRRNVQDRRSATGVGTPLMTVTMASLNEPPSGVSTTLASPAVSGTNTIVLTTTTGFAVGDQILIDQASPAASSWQQTLTITGIAMNTLTLSANLTAGYSAGSTVWDLETGTGSRRWLILAGNTVTTNT